MKRWFSVLVLIAAVVFMGNAMSTAQGFETELTILMGEFFFQLEGQAPNEPIQLETAVPYRITFKNVGNAVHRVKFGRGLIVEEGVPFEYAENLFDNVPLRIEGMANDTIFRVNTDRLLELDLEPGGELDIVFTLPQDAAGEWELGCFVVGHYEAGMLTALVVN